jgi:DNA-binding FadR family transcriptional regulator
VSSSQITNKRVYEQVANLISGLIDEGEFQRGQRLPPERDLAKRFGVSRPSVREAIIALETAGIVEVRKGQTFVAVRRADVSLQQAAADSAVWEQLEASALFEVKLARDAALRGRENAFDRLETILNAPMRIASGRSNEAASVTRRFHEAVAVASDNAFLASFALELWSVRSSPAWERFASRLSKLDSDTVMILERVRVLEALRLRDARQAAAAMARMHLRLRTILLE